MNRSSLLLAGLCCFVALSPASATPMSRTAVSGKPSVMFDYRSWDASCVSAGAKMDVTSAPKNGSVAPMFVNSTIPPGRKYGASPCTGKPIKALRVMYTPKRGFKGTDTFTIDVTYFGTGDRTTHEYTVTVE